MRRALSYFMLAAVATLGGHGAANAAPTCGGFVDYNCDYYKNSRWYHCYAWANYQCQDPQFTVGGLPGGTCNGTVDVACDDHGMNCTLWLSSTGCYIGII